MADLPVPRENFGVEPTNEVMLKWMDIQIQETKSRIARTKLDIEDLRHQAIPKLETNLMMLELKLTDLQNRRITIETGD